MNLKSWTFSNKFCGGTLVAAGVLAALRVPGAQPVLMAPPPVSTQPESVQEDSTNDEMSVFIPSYDARDNSLPQPFKFGPVVVRPHPYYQFVYASGLQASTNNSQHSIIQSFSPGVAVDLGRHWLLDYTPTIQFYSNRAFHNSIDHAASLTGGTSYEDWTFNLSQTYNKSDATLADTGGQTQTEAYDTELGVQRVLNDKLFAQFGVSQVFNSVSGQQDSRQWSTMDWLNYEVSQRLIFGAGVGGGYVDISSETPGGSNPNQAFEQMQGRVQWRATDKVSFAVSGGFEERQTLATGYKDELNPTFGASIEYAPFEHTQISLNAGRTVSSSDYYIIATSQEATTAGLSVSQRLLTDYFLNVGLAYTHTEYTTALSIVPVSDTRTDDNYSFNVRIGRTFLKRGNAAVTYQYSKDRSSVGGYSYNSSQIGFQVGFAY
jgi:hypothetical protein